MGRSDRRSRSRSRSRSRERRRRRDRGAEKASRSDERGGAPAPAPASAAAPKVSARVDYAAVRDSLNLKSGGDGEVSLTVNDSNALRARLGLRPLNDDKSSSAAEAQAVAERNFELQLLPTLVYVLKAQALDFTTVAIFSCADSCDASTDEVAVVRAAPALQAGRNAKL